MPFRADEASKEGYDKAIKYLVGTHLGAEKRQEAEDRIWELSLVLGPVIDTYPTWHPLVSHNADSRLPVTCPSEGGGYAGLDHTNYFAHGFVTCPYNSGQLVIDSVESLPEHPLAAITAERAEFPFYFDSTDPVIVRCEWYKALDSGKQIPKRYAVPLMLEKEIPNWRNSEVGETWATMRPYFLGEPHGSRSSLFVSQDTALAMKRVHEATIESRMYGPVMMR